MVTINSNVNGMLEHFSRNEDLTYKLKILGEDGLFHIYDKLTRACKANEYKVGDFVGESEELHYEVREHFLFDSSKQYKKENNKMNNLNEAQLEFVKHLVELAREAINYEYDQGETDGLTPDVIGKVVYESAVRNPVVVLETYKKLFDK